MSGLLNWIALTVFKLVLAIGITYSTIVVVAMIYAILEEERIAKEHEKLMGT